MDTLVLDVGYQPVSRVSWETSIVWVLDRVVEVVDAYPDRAIRTVGWSVPMPSIVRFLRPLPRRKAVKFSRENVYARDGGRCQYCGIRVRRSDFTYDHVVPRAQGGATRWENVVVCCYACNQRKAHRTPEQAGLRILSAPVKPKRLTTLPRPMTYQPSMPASWRDYLRDAAYWDGEMESDDGG